MGRTHAGDDTGLLLLGVHHHLLACWTLNRISGTGPHDPLGARLDHPDQYRVRVRPPVPLGTRGVLQVFDRTMCSKYKEIVNSYKVYIQRPLHAHSELYSLGADISGIAVPDHPLGATYGEEEVPKRPAGQRVRHIRDMARGGRHHRVLRLGLGFLRHQHSDGGVSHRVLDSDHG